MRAQRRPARPTAMVAVVLLLYGLAVPALATGGALDDAISLYRQARYGEALEKLEGLAKPSDTPGPGAEDSRRIAEYQALCLLALDRGDEARDVVRALLTREPGYQPMSGQFPPRFGAVVEETRAAVLPDVVRREYRLGKAKYDEKAYSEAEAHLRTVVTLLDNTALAPALRDSLADLRDVADGFLALIPKRAEPAPPPVDAAASLVPPAPAFYTAADPGVRAPMAVRQDMPPWRSVLEGGFRTPGLGRLELIVNEHGDVTSARLTGSISRLYDGQLLEAARRWHYQPATKDGRPVAFKKIIEVRVADPAANKTP